MGKMDYLAMKADQRGNENLQANLKELGVAAKKFANDAMNLGSIGFGTSFIKLVASITAIYLLILDRRNWRTNMLTSLLIPYIFLTLPTILFSFLRGAFGKWVAFIAIVLRLFFRRHFRDWLEIPGYLILLLVIAPNFFAHTIRDSWAGGVICLMIGCYLLLQENIRASSGFYNSFTQSYSVFNTLGVIALLVYPVWRLAIFM